MSARRDAPTPREGQSLADHLRDLDEVRDDDGGNAAPQVIEVLEPNWPAVRVYMACTWTVVPLSTMERVRLVHHGITASETRAACELLRIPRASWEDIRQRVQIMARAAGKVLNRSR